MNAMNKKRWMSVVMLVAAVGLLLTSCGDNDEVTLNGNGAKHDYVDLGLPSGTLWATCNIGASSPEEYGDYFAWGEITGYRDGKTVFHWDTYKWCNGTARTMTKYCIDSNYGIVDDKTELDLEDDAAFANWGIYWRIPSKEQLDELIDARYTTVEWVTQNDVPGTKVTSNKNGKSIFLPASGYYTSGHTLYAYMGDTPYRVGYYLSRTLIPKSSPLYEYYKNFVFGLSVFEVKNTNSNAEVSHKDRCTGHSIRPVRSSL